ncbi:hypothetical protein CEXT_151461, partial [Caerostris extrusa]
EGFSFARTCSRFTPYRNKSRGRLRYPNEDVREDGWRSIRLSRGAYCRTPPCFTSLHFEEAPRPEWVANKAED